MKIKFFILLISSLMFTSSCFVLAQSKDIQNINGYWLTPRIFIVGYGDAYDEMVAAVNTEKGIVIIDSGMSPSLTADYRKFIEKKLGRSDFRYVINTHHHDDHIWGNQVFEDADIIAHENAANHMQADYKNGANYIRQTQVRNEQLNLLLKTLDKNSDKYISIKKWIYPFEQMCKDYDTILKVTLPTISFSENLTLDMGDISIEMVYFGPGFHTDNSIIVNIPDEEVVFMGDIILQNDPYYPVNSQLNVEMFKPWIKSLDTILRNNPDVNKVVAFHDGILPGESLRDFYGTLIKMENELQFKINAVDSLRVLMTESNLNRAIGIFKSQFVDRRIDTYYIWLGDLLQLAEECQKVEKYHEAIAILKICEKIFPGSNIAISRQARIFLDQGDKKSALDIYMKYIRKNPDNYYTKARIFQLENEMGMFR